MDGKNGSAEQFREHYRRYYREVYQFYLYYTGDRNNAEDLTQEAFIRVMKALPSFSGRSAIKTWILNIARNVAVDHYRKKRLHEFFSMSFLKVLPASRKEQPEELVEWKEEQEVFAEALLRLKPAYRIVVILRGIKRYSVKETADILGCSEAKVKVDFHRALSMLREDLQSSGEGGWIREYS